MSIIEQMNAERRARLVRLGAISPPLPESEKRIKFLAERVEHQQDTIAELQDIVTRQRELIIKFADESESPTPRLNDILVVVAKHFKVTKQMVAGVQRSHNIVYPRQIVYFLGRKYGYSLPQIGRACGKDHTSALHGANKIKTQLGVDQVLRDHIEIIEDGLHKYVAERIKVSQEFLA